MLGVDASQNLLRMSMTAMDECNERRAEAEECSILPFDRLVDVAARRGRGVLLVRHADRDAFPKAMPPAERDRQPLNAAGRARSYASAPSPSSAVAWVWWRNQPKWKAPWMTHDTVKSASAKTPGGLRMRDQWPRRFATESSMANSRKQSEDQ